MVRAKEAFFVLVVRVPYQWYAIVLRPLKSRGDVLGLVLPQPGTNLSMSALSEARPEDLNAAVKTWVFSSGLWLKILPLKPLPA